MGQETEPLWLNPLWRHLPPGHLPNHHSEVHWAASCLLLSQALRPRPVSLCGCHPTLPLGAGLSYTTFEHGRPTVVPAEIHPGGAEPREGPASPTRARDSAARMWCSSSESARTGRRYAPCTTSPWLCASRAYTGEATDVTLDVGPEDLALWDIDMHHTVEPRTSTLEVARAARRWSPPRSRWSQRGNGPEGLSTRPPSSELKAPVGVLHQLDVGLPSGSLIHTWSENVSPNARR